ncbi:PAAR domain-containing protein [Chitinivorax sp. B]|uniref:PAAR domain-containing protein n=1 Tax=Chitinivorax sp. B TaxID=2502235 RepID=UPI0010F5FBCB|nr:PAAR domain-containing protein [Chitinivorax sp. B]
MRKVIRLGDPHSHGGNVISVRATHVTLDAIPLACVGDVCSCPIPGHNNCTIVEGDSQHTIDGIPVAYEGHKTSCGASLIATAGHFGKT